MATKSSADQVSLSAGGNLNKWRLCRLALDPSLGSSSTLALLELLRLDASNRLITLDALDRLVSFACFDSAVTS